MRNRKSSPQHQVLAWQFKDILLEAYDYAPGKAEVCEQHIHADYQLCLSLDFPGTYAYRGVSYPVPTGSLSILHPGEKHSSADPEDRCTRAHYCLFYLPPHLLQQTVSVELAKPSASLFFPDPVLLDTSLFRNFLQLHRTLGSSTPLLEQESLLQSLLLNLTQRYAADCLVLPAVRPDRHAVQCVKAYIDDNYPHNISLNDLAQLVEFHPVYLNAVFRKVFGVPPHVYQTHQRIERAKRLLASGVSPGEVAQQVGFYDQSHFGKYFRRYTGVTPAYYRTLKMS